MNSSFSDNPEVLRSLPSATTITPVARSGGPITVHAVISTTDVVRDGGVVEAWVLDNYLKNPVVCLEHDMTTVIGRASNLQNTPCGLEADITFMGEDVNPKAHAFGKMVAGGWYNAFSAQFVLLGRRQPTAEEKAKGAKWIGTGDLIEISLVGVPVDPNAVVTKRTIDLLSSDVDLIRQEVVARPEWETVLRSLEASTRPPVPAPPSTPVARAVDADLWTELRDLATRMLEITDELGLQVEPRSFKSDVAGSSAQQAPSAPAVVEVRSGASASALDMHRLLDAMRRGTDSNGDGKQGS